MASDHDNLNTKATPNEASIEGRPTEDEVAVRQSAVAAPPLPEEAGRSDAANATDGEQAKGARQSQDSSQIDIESVNHSSHTTRATWIFFLVVMVYFFISVSGVTHKDLLLETPVKLPALGVELNINRFFLFAPLGFLFVFLGVALQHTSLAVRLHRLNSLINDASDGAVAANAPNSKAYSQTIRYALSTFSLVEVIAGTHRRWLTWAVVLSTLCITPVMTVMWCQLIYLPYHDVFITSVHQAVVVMTVLLSIYVVWYLTRSAMLRAATIALHALLTMISLFIFTVPDSPLDSFTRSAWPMRLWTTEVGAAKRSVFWPTAWLLESPVDWVTGRPIRKLSRNLVVVEEAVSTADTGVSLRGRDLRHARFDRSTIRHADLTGSDLTAASFYQTDLTSAKIGCAAVSNNLKEAAQLPLDIADIATEYGAPLNDDALSDDSWSDYNCTNLTETVFYAANMQRLSWDGQISLRGSNFSNADLQGAQLQKADLYMSKLNYVDLTGASLSAANLVGADLSGAILNNTDLSSANLQVAKLSDSYMIDTNLHYADLSHAIVWDAIIAYTCMTTTSLRGVDLDSTLIWRSSPPIKDKLYLANTARVIIEAPGTDSLTPVIGSEGYRSLDKVNASKVILSRLAAGGASHGRNEGCSDVEANQKWSKIARRLDRQEDDGYDSLLQNDRVKLACYSEWLAIPLIERYRDNYKYYADASSASETGALARTDLGRPDNKVSPREFPVATEESSVVDYLGTIVSSAAAPSGKCKCGGSWALLGEDPRPLLRGLKSEECPGGRVLSISHPGIISMLETEAVGYEAYRRKLAREKPTLRWSQH